MLTRQKAKIGFAILGHPLGQIVLDKNIKGELQVASKQVGEQLALSTSQVELFVPDIAKVDKGQIRQFIGRSQFPKLRTDVKALKSLPDYIKHDDTLLKVAQA